MIESWREHCVVGANEDDPEDDIGDGGNDLMLQDRQEPFRVVSAESAVDDICSTQVGVLQGRSESRGLRVVTELYQTKTNKLYQPLTRSAALRGHTHLSPSRIICGYIPRQSISVAGNGVRWHAQLVGRVVDRR
jgi:hypothetical protein